MHVYTLFFLCYTFSIFSLSTHTHTLPPPPPPPPCVFQMCFQFQASLSIPTRLKLLEVDELPLPELCDPPTPFNLSSLTSDLSHGQGRGGHRGHRAPSPAVDQHCGQKVKRQRSSSNYEPTWTKSFKNILVCHLPMKTHLKIDQLRLIYE